MPDKEGPKRVRKIASPPKGTATDFVPLLKEQIRIQEQAIVLWKWWVFGLAFTGTAILVTAQVLRIGGPAVSEVLKLGGTFVGILGVIPYREIIPRKERLATYRFLLASLSSPIGSKAQQTTLLSLATDALKETLKR